MLRKAENAMTSRHWFRAIQLLQRSLKLNPNFLDAHFHLTLAFYHIKDLVSAEKHAHKVLRINPSEPNAYLNLGAIKDKQGKIRSAIRYYNLELLNRKECLEAHFNLGVIYYQKKRWSLCLNHLNSCWQAHHQGSELDYMLGLAAFKLRQCVLEMAVYRRVLRRNPNDVWALNNLAAMHIDRSNFRAAKNLLLRVKSLAPNDPVVNRNLDKIAIKRVNARANQ